GPIDADDAWSETFLAALKAYPRLPPGSNIQGWILTIAHRKSIDLIRARLRNTIPLDELPERPSELGIPGARENDLWRAIASLPDRQRLAVAYHYLGGLPHAATAEIIGGTPASVRRASADGITSLR